MDAIQDEIDFYKSRRLEFITQYANKHLAIKGMEVIGVYNSYTEAMAETTKLHESGTFIIEHPVDIAARLQLVKKRSV